jgi:hypothetical protein
MELSVAMEPVAAQVGAGRGPSTVYYVAEPYMLARDACIDAQARSQCSGRANT